MVRGIGIIKTKKEKKKSPIERDIERCKDISVAYSQGGKAIGEIFKLRRKKDENEKN